MATPGVRQLIWLSVKPLIRIAIPATVGFTLVKRKLFPGEGTKALSLLIINFTLPCLLFSRIVPSFTPEDVHALGPILLAAFFYQALPGILGVLARAVTETPRCFRHGGWPSGWCTFRCTVILNSVWHLLRPIVTSPPTMVLLSALIIALIPDLGVLFVPPTSSNASFTPTAPDGLPPLAVLYDTLPSSAGYLFRSDRSSSALPSPSFDFRNRCRGCRLLASLQWPSSASLLCRSAASSL